MKQREQQEDKTEMPGFFRQVTNWKELRFYQKTEVLYQLTYVFCERFLPKYGDRTVDQMIQAARSGKQNIVEGAEDGKMSNEMELKLFMFPIKVEQEEYIKKVLIAIMKNKSVVEVVFTINHLGHQMED